MALLNHIAIHVKDLERSKIFYKSVLGLKNTFEHNIYGEQFEKVSGIKGFNVVFSVLTDNESKVNLEIVEFKNGLDEKISIFNHIAFEVEDVDILYEKLTLMDVDIISEPVTLKHQNPKINGKRFFYFHDPDGYVIEVFNSKKGLYSD